jgi:hypothetical protein
MIDDNRLHRRAPSPALLVAMLALFVALGGTAFAGSATVRHALAADRAKALAADAITIRTAQGTIPSNRLSPFTPSDFYAGCAKGEKVISGGFDAQLGRSSGGDLDNVFAMGENPTGTENFGVESWHVRAINYGNSAAAITVYAVCIAAA